MCFGFSNYTPIPILHTTPQGVPFSLTQIKKNQGVPGRGSHVHGRWIAPRRKIPNAKYGKPYAGHTISCGLRRGRGRRAENEGRENPREASTSCREVAKKRQRRGGRRSARYTPGEGVRIGDYPSIGIRQIPVWGRDRYQADTYSLPGIGQMAALCGQNRGGFCPWLRQPVSHERQNQGDFCLYSAATCLARNAWNTPRWAASILPVAALNFAPCPSGVARNCAA